MAVLVIAAVVVGWSIVRMESAEAVVVAAAVALSLVSRKKGTRITLENSSSPVGLVRRRY